MDVTTFPTTIQQLFDNAWNWAIVEKNEQCYALDDNDERCCRYRDAGGNRCLIGVSIPDAMYDSCMEGAASGGLLESYFPAFNAAAAALDPSVQQFRNAARALQTVHDLYSGSAARWPEYIRTGLVDFASNQGLAIPDAVPAQEAA